MKKKISLLFISIAITLSLLSFVIGYYRPEIPKVWDMERIMSMHLPLPDTSMIMSPVSEEYYYQLPERVAYKSYPFYMPGKEPAGYYEWLRTLQPEITFNAANLKTEEDWIKAGEVIYDMPQTYRLMDSTFLTAMQVLGKYLQQFHINTTKEGIIPFLSIVVREKGRIELGTASCGMCHTKVMPDSSILKGGQGNFVFSHFVRSLFRVQREVNHVPDSVIKRNIRANIRLLWEAPWVKHESQDRLKKITIEEWLENSGAAPGLDYRQGTGYGYPASTPDLFNLEKRKHFDRTGTAMQRDIVDLMRYATLNQGTETLHDFKGFTAVDRPTDPQKGNITRISDEQLYALAKYIYSLKTPKNPTVYPKELLKRGQEIFVQEGCDNCHTPPLYSNNKLTPVDGFTPPAEHFKKYSIYDMSVGTDSVLSLYTRRGTGYYKIPSLIGAWNRTSFLHNGNLATLEDMFDSTRFSPDYIPTGYRPPWITHMAIRGHDFGTRLNPKDKQALIAFVKSL